MKKAKRLLLSLFFAVSQVCLLYRGIQAFDDEAHRNLSARSVQVSTLDNFLETSLGFEFPFKTDEIIHNNRSVRQLFQDGALDEDRPILWRPRHHFHNPRLPWDQAGWRPPPFSVQLGKSSVMWSQDENQSVGGKHSWKDARDSYFNALTATDPTQRRQYWAETFRSLGHLIHLVQDAAVPSHTRNDTHVSYKGVGDPDAFHGWAETATDIISGITPPPFNTSLLNQSSANPLAPVPIARLIDSTDGDIGSLALLPGSNIGLGEYSSANFYSDDTINSPNFQSPLPSQVEVRAPEPDATGTRLRRYVYFRPGFGEQDYPLALASAMYSYVIDPLTVPTESGLDTKVFQGYGAKLFPRAIGYSAGLIDYFFRNHMVGNAGDIGCFGPPPPPNNPYYDNFALAVGTAIPGEQPASGRIVVVVHYTSAGQDNYFTLLDTTATLDPELGASWTLSSQPLYQIPLDASEVYFVIAYRGPLGQETDAVVGGYGFFWGLC